MITWYLADPFDDFPHPCRPGPRTAGSHVARTPGRQGQGESTKVATFGGGVKRLLGGSQLLGKKMKLVMAMVGCFLAEDVVGESVAIRIDLLGR